MRRKRQKSTGGSLLELVLIVAVALGLALGIQAFLIKPYRIPSGSMEPTLDVGQRVLVNRIGNRFNDPHVGEIIVFHPPCAATGCEAGKGANGECGVDNPPSEPCPQPVGKESGENFIKRVVAGPGDTIAVRNGHVIRNGKLQKEPFISHSCDNNSGGDCNLPRAIKIPPGHWFMMGDNRGESDDSRYWGPVPKKWIIGGAFATYWPPKRIGFL
ncbi:MAG TPA: signal peptidase I [Solirubrobacteraceae bacterium]|nr:signal peptidase I [Solirubrobacteraceae bacterium]